MNIDTLLKTWQDAGLINPLERRLADTLRRLAETDNPWILLAAILAEQAITAGHSCFDLRTVTNKPILSLCKQTDHDADSETTIAETLAHVILPDWQTWQNLLDTPPACRIFGDEDDATPLVRLDSRVYLRRFRRYERLVEQKIQNLADANDSILTLNDTSTDSILLASLTAQQRRAVELARQRRLVILSGGPGTGKTYTIAIIVATLAQRADNRPWCIRLAAPTGKAAARMQASLIASRQNLLANGFPPETFNDLPVTASTIHRLLGSIPDSPRFRHHADNPLDLDLLIVDEASMIDLPLMAKLLDALPQHARLILVGDAAQLASVEPGRVFGDLCRAARPGASLNGCLCQLTESRRFPDTSPIGIASRCINAGDPETAWKTLRDLTPPTTNNTDAGATLHDLASVDLSTFAIVRDPAFRAVVKLTLTPFLQATSPEEALNHSTDLGVLTPLRRGPAGVAALNTAVEHILAGSYGFTPQKGFYPHQLIMITRNTPDIRLFNGDTGVIFPDPEQNGQLAAFFPPETSGYPLHKVPLAQLPECQTAFALTIHKSQGSEFNIVALVLTGPADTPLLTRELLYTGMTRTRQHLHLWTTKNILTTTTQRQITRHSGMFAATQKT